MEKLLISACLLGTDCKYSGGNNRLPEEQLRALREHWDLVPVCPEVLGGLPVPRDPSERRGDRVVSCRGADVTAEYEKGAQLALRTAQKEGCATALLKQRSPSCGAGQIYDGTFTGTVLVGDGVAAALLKRHGIRVLSENDIRRLLEAIPE